MKPRSGLSRARHAVDLHDQWLAGPVPYKGWRLQDQSEGSQGILIQVMGFLPGLYVLVSVFHCEGFDPLVDGLLGLAVP
jgi:hypothetical protein